MHLIWLRRDWKSIFWHMSDLYSRHMVGVFVWVCVCVWGGGGCSVHFLFLVLKKKLNKENTGKHRE